MSPPLPALPASGSTPTKGEAGALGQSFIISVGDPQTVGNAFNVAAQHTVYTVRTQTTSPAFRKKDFSVLRRFSHFLWLFDALTLNNPGVIVPGMPEKSALGRFGAEFVENRRSGLQAALMKIVSHPMLVGDPDLRLFLESDTFSVDIKQRRIESPSEGSGFLASWTNSISGPKFVEFDEYFDNRRQTLDTFEVQLKGLLSSITNAAKYRAALHQSYGELQSALIGLSLCDLSGPLRSVLEKGAALQKRLLELGDEQLASEEQIGGLTAVAEGYARLCGSVKLVFGARIKAYHAWQAADLNFRKAAAAHEKAKKSGRAHGEMLGLSLGETADAERKMMDAKQDFEDVSKLTKAEMARFDKEKIDDFKRAVAVYADGMVSRQREVRRAPSR
ncbi:Vps5-domain-containing protein [Meredithblackwellia eburnea MCA 4105]